MSKGISKCVRQKFSCHDCVNSPQSTIQIKSDGSSFHHHVNSQSADTPNSRDSCLCLCVSLSVCLSVSLSLSLSLSHTHTHRVQTGAVERGKAHMTSAGKTNWRRTHRDKPVSRGCCAAWAGGWRRCQTSALESVKRKGTSCKRYVCMCTGRR